MCKAFHCEARHAMSVSFHDHTRWLIRGETTANKWKSVILVLKVGSIPDKIIYCSFILHGQVESNRPIRRMPHSFCPNTICLLRPIDAYMRQWTAPSFDKFMVCRLFATSHYLKQCWLIVNWTTKVIYSNEILFANKWFSFKKMHSKMSLAKVLSRSQCVSMLCDRPQLLVGYWEGIKRQWFNNV